MGKNEFDFNHLRELYEKELNGENTPPEKEQSEEKPIDQGRFGEKKASPDLESTNSIVNQGSFGQKKTHIIEASWACPACETVNTGNFCSVCGAKRPETEKEKLERELRDAEEQERQARELREKEEREKQALKEKNKKPLIIGLCAVMALIVLFLVIQNGPYETITRLNITQTQPVDTAVQSAQQPNSIIPATADTEEGLITADWKGKEVLSICCVSDQVLEINVIDPRAVDASYWMLQLYSSNYDQGYLEILSNETASVWEREGWFFWLDNSDPSHIFNVQHWIDKGGNDWNSVNGSDLVIYQIKKNHYSFTLDLNSFPGFSWNSFSGAILIFQNAGMSSESEIWVDWIPD